MYFPPNSFSIRWPTITSGSPGGIWASTSSRTRSRVMKKPSVSVTSATAAMTSLGRRTMAVTYRRSMSAPLPERADEALARVALGREVAGQHHPPRSGLAFGQIEQHLASLGEHHGPQRVGRDRVDEPVVLLVAAVGQ